MEKVWYQIFDDKKEPSFLKWFLSEAEAREDSDQVGSIETPRGSNVHIMALNNLTTVNIINNIKK